MLDLLRSLEWSVYGACPSCRQVSSHAPDCRLDRAIRELTEHPLRGFLLHEVRDGVAEYRGCVATSGMPAPVGTIAFTEPSPPEPTVDEMARDARPTFADKLRALGLPTEMEHNGMYCHDHRGPALWIAMGEWVYSLGPHVGPGRRRWPTAEAAVDELYAEWVAKQQAALAAWLFARVVPGRTVVEWEAPSVDRVRRCKSLVVNVEIDGDHIVVWPNDSALYIPPPSKHVTRATRLLNPDGTVLWEAK